MTPAELTTIALENAPRPPRTTFDRWQPIYEADDAYDVTGAIRTFF